MQGPRSRFFWKFLEGSLGCKSFTRWFYHLWSIDHPQSLVWNFKYAWRSLRRHFHPVSDNFPNRLTDDAGSLMWQRLHRPQIAQQISLALHLHRRGVEVVILEVHRVCRWKRALIARPQVHALAPQVFRFFLYINRIADLDLQLVVVPWKKFVESTMSRFKHLKLTVRNASESWREGRVRWWVDVWRCDALEVVRRVSGAVTAVDVAQTVHLLRVGTRVFVQQVAALECQQRVLLERLGTPDACLTARQLVRQWSLVLENVRQSCWK